MSQGANFYQRPTESLLSALIGDGRPLLSLTGIALILSGGFMLFLSVTGSFLPHDIAYLGMDAAQLCGLAQCRVVHFMFHDRVSFGGVLIAIGTLYLWLAEFPLRRGEEWAWWVFAVSGASGFASFLSYLGYGYLDTWHGIATLVLLPLYVVGMWRSRQLFPGEPRLGWRSLRSPTWRPRGWGRFFTPPGWCSCGGSGREDWPEHQQGGAAWRTAKHCWVDS